MRRISDTMLRSVNNCFLQRYQAPHLIKALSTSAPSGNGVDDRQRNTKSFESADEFEKRMFGGFSGTGSTSDSFFQRLDRLEKSRRLFDMNGSEPLDELDESFNTLSDGMDGKLKKAATFFEIDEEEMDQDDYSFRPDMSFEPGDTYETRDLDLTKPGVYKPAIRDEFEVTSEEALKKADFRNVRFLANFITEAGIIIKRSQTGISAKAQRKVAREIKTARAFGLLPFTTMGTKSFIFGRNMENRDVDFEYETNEGPVVADMNEEDPL